jgi:hypothetical protein
LAALSAACGEVVPLTPDAPVDAPEIDAPVDPCTKSELTVDEFVLCLGRQVCVVYEDCIGSDTATINCDDIPIRVFGDLAPTALKLVLASAQAAGRAQWNPAAAKQCIDMLTAGGCGIFKNDDDVFDACNAITGSVNNAQLCQNDIECATPGAQCEQTSGSPGNMCTDFTCRAPVATGQMCTAGAFCRVGDHCVRRVQGADISFCGAGGLGDQCDDDGDCDRGSFCNGGLGTGTVMGICTASKAAGQTCKTDEECMGELACVGNFGAINGICRDVRPPGATCDANGGFYSCHGNQLCNSARDMTGTCTAAPALGQACVNVNGTPACGFFLACVNGLCREPGGIGEACGNPPFFGGFGSEFGCNIDLFCDRDLTGAPMGTCREPQANGASCAYEDNCASDYCQGTDFSMNPPRLGTCQTYPTCSF